MTTPLVPVVVLDAPLVTVTVLTSTTGPVTAPMLVEPTVAITLADVIPPQAASGHPQFATLDW